MTRRPLTALISDERFPFTGANAEQVVKSASALAKAGWPVELVVPAEMPAPVVVVVDILKSIVREQDS